jgi:hypothetical protein
MRRSTGALHVFHVGTCYFLRGYPDGPKLKPAGRDCQLASDHAGIADVWIDGDVPRLK